MFKLWKIEPKVPQRVKLVNAKGLESSYFGQKTGKRLDVKFFGEGSLICPDMFEALKELNLRVKDRGGNLYITDLFRSWKTQEEARKNKKVYMAKPGQSFHNAGRAIDIDVFELDFYGKRKDGWLEVFWDIAIPLGFKPIISNPTMEANESWHFDYPGKDWSLSYDLMSYAECAKCCVLDVGKYDSGEDLEKIKRMFIQSQLNRLGYDTGGIDSIFGPKTQNALDYLIGGPHLSLDIVIKKLIRL